MKLYISIGRIRVRFTPGSNKTSTYISLKAYRLPIFKGTKLMLQVESVRVWALTSFASLISANRPYWCQMMVSLVTRLVQPLFQNLCVAFPKGTLLS